MKKALKSFLPLILLEYWRSYRSPWKGDYIDWNSAKADCGSYNSEIIFDKVFDSTLKVKNNKAVYERDSVLFEKKEYSWPLAFALAWCCSENNKLEVLDFGGALGSSFYQNKDFLNLSKTKWVVVEQDRFVKLGNSKIADKNLKFESSIENAFNSYQINFVLISSTLQYLDDPYLILQSISSFKPKYIFLDRLSIVDKERDIITKQTVSSDIYEASYPCRFFNKKNIYSLLEKDYELISEFDSFVINQGLLNYRTPHKDIGAIFKIKVCPLI